MMRFNFERLPRRGKLKNGQLEMTTPSRFMNIVREHWKRIPTHRGDWPDWWTDGVASMPSETGYIREARRGLEALVAAKANHGAYLAPGLQAKIEDALILYAEHTFGHSDSMKTPWDRTCRHIESNKRALAAAGLSAVEEARGLAMAALGESPMRPGRPFRYRVVNPFNEPVHRMVRLYIESFEFDVRDVAPIVWHVEEKRELPVQRESAPRGWNFLVTIEIPASGIIHLDLQEGIPSLPHIGAHPADCALDNGPSVDAFPASQTQAVTGREAALDHCRIRFVLDSGVIALDGIFDNDYLPLVDIEAARPAFTPVYERTPVQPVNDSAAQLEARMRMGRNRKGEDVHRSDGVLLAVDLVDDGPVRSSYALRFALEGTSMAEVHIHLRKDAPELELAFRLHKESVWDPENLFLALPFTADGDPRIWLDRAGAAVLPPEDQLPGTLTDWYCLQSGYAVCGATFGLAVTPLDAPLLQLGPLEYGNRALADDAMPRRYPRDAYSYLMTNYWETNFPASLGGFHEFRYRVRWSTDFVDPARALNACREMERECFVLGEQPISFRKRAWKRW